MTAFARAGARIYRSGLFYTKRSLGRWLIQVSVYSKHVIGPLVANVPVFAPQHLVGMKADDLDPD